MVKGGMYIHELERIPKDGLTCIQLKRNSAVLPLRVNTTEHQFCHFYFLSFNIPIFHQKTCSRWLSNMLVSATRNAHIGGQAQHEPTRAPNASSFTFWWNTGTVSICICDKHTKISEPLIVKYRFLYFEDNHMNLYLIQNVIYIISRGRNKNFNRSLCLQYFLYISPSVTYTHVNAFIDFQVL